MEGGLLALIIVSPIASLIACYRCFNHGKMPCVDTSNIDNHGQVLPEE